MTNEERFEEAKALHGAALARGELVECNRGHEFPFGCRCTRVGARDVFTCQVDRAHGPARALVDDGFGGMFVCLGCKAEADAAEGEAA